MAAYLHSSIARRLLLVAAPLALCLTFLFPATASAHAILLSSDPAKDAVLRTAPRGVRMWFSEDLNPVFSMASVVNATNANASNINSPSVRVDNHDAHVSASNSREMDITLQPNLPPAAYIVLYRTDSAEDGHILNGSFVFYVARPDGTIPTVNTTGLAGINGLSGSNSSGLYTGQIDGPTAFNLVAITLVELGAIFWVGAQLWLIFVLQPLTQDHNEEGATNQRVQERFERRFSLPTLLVLLVANIAVLLGQALYVNNTPLTPALLVRLVTSGRFGTFWTMREIVIIIALVLAVYGWVRWRAAAGDHQGPVSGGDSTHTTPHHPRPYGPEIVNSVLPWVNLILGLALFMAISMSSHAAAVSANLLLFAVPVDWLHLLAAAFWIGGMLYIATTYLPVIRRSPVAERTRALITILPYYSPWALAAVGLMAVTGPLNATFHFNSLSQLITTAYGRALDVKILLVCALLATSAYHVGLLRPRLKKEYKKYSYAAGRLTGVGAGPTQGPTQPAAEAERTPKLITQQVKLREGRLSRGTHRLMNVLSWEPLLGVGVIICVGLMNVFAGTLSPTAAAQQPRQTTTSARPFVTTVETSDKKFAITLNINPDRFGTNLFTATVVDLKTGKPTTKVGVSLYTTMLDMDMGTDTVNLLPDGKGHFSALGDLSMGGNWQVRIQIRTPDGTLHGANIRFYVPF